MSTLAEIEAAIPRLTAVELAQLEKLVQAERQKSSSSGGHSVLDIPAVSVGAFLQSGTTVDLLEEMLEGRE